MRGSLAGGPARLVTRINDRGEFTGEQHRIFETVSDDVGQKIIGMRFARSDDGQVTRGEKLADKG